MRMGVLQSSPTTVTSSAGTVPPMARSGPQSIPGVTLRTAYRFESTDVDDPFEGIVFKRLPRRLNWEARIDDTTIVAVGETRRDAVERAIAERSS